jgi:Xaa-Pro dipeptidase
MTIPREVAFPVDEYRRRVARVHGRMAERGLDAIVLFGPHNIAYLTGMDSENLFDPQACIVAAGSDPTLVILDFELGRFANSAWLEKPVTYGQFDDPVAAFAEAISAVGLSRSRLGIDRRGIGAEQYQRLLAALPAATAEDGFGVVERVRLVKSEAEIDLMRRAAGFTDAGVEAGFAAIAAGRRDYEVAAAIVEALYAAGSDLTCWGPIVAAGYRSGLAHSAHNGKTLEKGESVFLELTGQLRRYAAPLMRTAVIGRASDEQRRLGDASASAVAAILDAAKAGTPAKAVAAAGLRHIAPVEQGIVFHHNFGYPVGLAYPPSWIETLGFFLRANNPEPIEAGMVFHLPMSLRVAGRLGICLSHTMLVTVDGGVALTRSPARLREL